jgi:hypothetical protein
VESAFSTGKFHVIIDGTTVVTPFSVPLTGPWDTAASWKTVSLGTVTLKAGTHVVTVLVDAPWFDLNYLAFVPVPSTTTTVKYIQSAYATPQIPQSTVPVTYPTAQTAGNLNVVIVGWDDTVNSISSVTDSKGNIYKLASGPVQFNSLRQSIYYASNIATGSNTVTVTFTGSAVYPDVRILEYSGVNGSNPLDIAAGSGGSGSTSSAGPVTTSSVNDLLIGANMVATGASGPGTGFTQRILTGDGDIVEDKIGNPIGSYTATVTLSPGDWVMQIVGFRAATQ